jgi:hypothetical protein
MSFRTLIGTASAMAVLLTAPATFAHDVKIETEETYDLKGFDTITVEGVYHLDVKVGDRFSVETSGTKKDMAKIRVYVEDGALVLGRKDKKGLKNNNNHGVNAVVTLPRLKAMEIAGVVTGDVTGIDADTFELEFAGVGELELNGRCDDLVIDMAGIGELDAKGLKCGDVEVNLAGMGEATVYASDRVDANAAGMGQIDVYGNPDVVQKSSAFLSKVHIR